MGWRSRPRNVEGRIGGARASPRPQRFPVEELTALFRELDEYGTELQQQDQQEGLTDVIDERINSRETR